MSEEVAGSYRKEGNLRRSKRKRKGVVPTKVESSSSGTESVESDSGTVLGWNVSEVESEIEVSGQSFGDFSEQSHWNSDLSKSIKGEQRREMSRESRDSGKGATPEPGLSDFMRIYFEDMRKRDEMEKERREVETERREEERKERREEQDRRDREQAIKEEVSRAREERLLLSLRDSRPPAPEPIPRLNIDLPRMRDSDEVAKFLPMFEMAL